jgi:hypothetical protein
MGEDNFRDYPRMLGQTSEGNPYKNVGQCAEASRTGKEYHLLLHRATTIAALVPEIMGVWYVQQMCNLPTVTKDIEMKRTKDNTQGQNS